MFSRLVSEVYEKTHTLGVNLERVTKDQLEVLDLADALFADYLSDHPEMELRWMSGMYERQVISNLPGETCISYLHMKILQISHSKYEVIIHLSITED